MLDLGCDESLHMYVQWVLLISEVVEYLSWFLFWNVRNELPIKLRDGGFIFGRNCLNWDSGIEYGFETVF